MHYAQPPDVHAGRPERLRGGEVIDAARSVAGGGDREGGGIGTQALHDFALPLVRYAIGDWAVPGPPCDCGRALTVIARVLGRTRNMLVAAGGRSYWFHIGSRGFAEIAPILQHQFVQKSLDEIEARLVTARPLTAQEEEALRRYLLARLPVPFTIRFRYLEEIARAPGGKFEHFISEVAPGRP